jgi:hypothetical protein
MREHPLGIFYVLVMRRSHRTDVVKVKAGA